MKIIIIAYLLVITLLTTGYVMNLYKLVKLDFNSPFKAEVIRVIGIFTPISIVTGFIDIKD